ncbi:MAG: 4Fe-4S binding protein, partial [Dehalococcoidia bacterium]|nr:4Fe-4S binding protein [Dehalococcoidia bacterium]
NGDKWYFNPANYARRMYKIRKDEVEATGTEGNPQAGEGGMGGGATNEIMEAYVNGDHETYERLKQEAEERAWRVHFGQVVTLEEATKLADLMFPIARMTCGCRRNSQGVPDEENMSCIGMGPGMYKWERWPETYRGGVEFITPDQLKEFLLKLNKTGYVHTIAAFGTPYLGGLCNCDYPDCVFIRDAVDYGIRRLWKGHSVAQVDTKLCNGCGLCVKRCQFKALTFSGSRNQAHIDMRQCYGCGNCRAVCKPGAIGLRERVNLPALEAVW